MSTMRQPRHRRPSWAKDPESYRLHMTADFVREGDDQPMSETEGYSYSQDYYVNWALVGHLRDQLPAWLVKQIDDWSNAGAAVETSLERIAHLDNESLDRGWPEKKSGCLSRTTSNGIGSMASPTPPSSSSSPMSSFTLESCVKKHLLPTLQTDLARAHLPLSQTVSSPPWTPDSSMPVIEESAVLPGPSHPIDAEKLNRRLADVELVEHSKPSPKLSPVAPPFDQSAWERFIEEYRREMNGVQEEDIVRFRHARRRIDMDIGIMLDEDPHALDAYPMAEYRAWWTEILQKQHKLEDQVNEVRLPRLDDIRHLRKVYGLNV